MRKNIASQTISAQLIATADGSEVTTGTTSVFVTIDAGTQTAGVGTIVHEGSGVWSYAPTQAETNGNNIVFTFKNATAITTSIQVYTISFDPHDVASLGLTNLDATISSRSTFNAASDAVANVTLVGTTTNVTNDVGITQTGADKVWGSTTRSITDKAGFTISGTKTTLDSLNDITAASVWSVGTRALTDKAGFTLASLPTIPANWITATGIAASALNGKGNWNIGKTGYSLTTLPTIPSNWITAAGINAGALNGKGDWNIGKTGYSLTQTFPANFADLKITATTGRVDINVNNDKSGYSIDTNNDKSGYSLSQSFPSNFSSLAIDVSGNVNSFTQGFISTALTEATAGRIAGNFDTFFENGDTATTKIVNDVGTAISGGGEFTATEKNQIRYRLGMDGVTAVPTATPDLAQKSDITSLNDFDPAVDVVARVTLVDTTTANTDMRGTDNALLASSYTAAPTTSQIADAVWDEAQAGHTTVGTFGYFLDAQVSAGGGGGTTPADIWSYATRELTSSNNIVLAKGTGVTGLNDIAATDIVTGGAIATTSGAIDNVTLVDVTTLNNDMRGTDSALLASSYVAPDNASITSILADTSTTIPAQISGLNDLSFNDIWTGQLTESYAADGVAPTATQAILMTQQFLTDFNITGSSYNVKRLDGITAAATFTLDDSANPTSITRSS